eukprot:3641604-Heterocapsa_arctica.AAC.1
MRNGCSGTRNQKNILQQKKARKEMNIMAEAGRSSMSKTLSQRHRTGRTDRQLHQNSEHNKNCLVE